jgi:hypothetical protein
MPSKISYYYSPTQQFEWGQKLATNPNLANRMSTAQLESLYGDAFSLGVQSVGDGYGGLNMSQYANINTQNSLIDALNNRNDLLSSQNTTNAWLGGTNTALQGISTIGGLVMSIKNYQMQKDALKKQSELIDEQISASKESRAQRKAELSRLNNVRSNTNKMFNNSAVVSRSY